MDQKYLEYCIEDLIQDRDFVSWVLHQNKNDEWHRFIAQFPDFGKTARTARKIIYLLEDSHSNLSESDIYKLWETIDQFDNQQKRRSKIRKLKRVFQYAAIVLLLVTISGVAAMYFLNSRESYPFSGSDSGIQLSESRLVLSSGNEIRLKKDYSTVVLQKEGIQINNDSIIFLKDAGVKNSNKLNELIIPYGKRSQMVLEDGTKIWLNAGSRIAFPTKFENNSRIVYLDGEAYFEVAHHEKHPFYVDVNNIEVRVLGTRFNVSAYSSDLLIETVLLEGEVAIRETGRFPFLKKEIVLRPDQKAIYNKEQKITQVVNELNPDHSIGWIKGWFNFSQQRLVDILNKLQRFYNVRFEYDAGFISNELITGKLDLKNSIEDILAFLSDLSKVEFSIKDNTVFVKKRIDKLPMKK